jgi:hypothetical protein
MPERPAELYHFSEDPGIRRFAPRIAPTQAMQDEVVWGVDPALQQAFFFPRECPRVCYYAGPETTHADRELFFGHSTASYVAAIEAGWLERLRSTVLYRYVFPPDGFELTDECAGYWVARKAVEPLRIEPVGDLLQAHANAGVELRILPSLWPLYEAVIASTLQFSVIRWRNAAPQPETAPIESGGAS